MLKGEKESVGEKIAAYRIKHCEWPLPFIKEDTRTGKWIEG